MRISDWSSDVCSSDLTAFEAPSARLRRRPAGAERGRHCRVAVAGCVRQCAHSYLAFRIPHETVSPRRARRLQLDRVRADRKRAAGRRRTGAREPRSEEHTSELQSLMRISYAVFCLKKKQKHQQKTTPTSQNDTTRTSNTQL